MNAPYRNSWIRTTAALATATALLSRSVVHMVRGLRSTAAARPTGSRIRRRRPAGLADEQRRVAEKFKRFEQVIKLLAQFCGRSRSRSVAAAPPSVRRSAGPLARRQVRRLGEGAQRQAGDQEAMTQQLEELLGHAALADGPARN
ncbi:MAG: hypothetical protein QM775_17590 [Pirellulales bacterium]